MKTLKLVASNLRIGGIEGIIILLVLLLSIPLRSALDEDVGVSIDKGAWAVTVCLIMALVMALFVSNNLHKRARHESPIPYRWLEALAAFAVLILAGVYLLNR